MQPYELDCSTSMIRSNGVDYLRCLDTGINLAGDPATGPAARKRKQTSIKRDLSDWKDLAFPRKNKICTKLECTF